MQAGEDFHFRAEDYFEWNDRVKESDLIVDTSALDLNRVGEYPVTVSYRREQYTVTVSVVDEKAPALKMTVESLFTNDLSGIGAQTLGVYEDVSECVERVGNYEKGQDLAVLSEEELEGLTSGLTVRDLAEETAGLLEELPPETEEPSCDWLLDRLVDDRPPAEEGVYRAQMAVSDVWCNASEGNWILVYDTTPPLLEGVQDVTVVQEDPSVPPVPDLSGLQVTDNVDGDILTAAVSTEVSETDAAGHVYTVRLSCMDRAGNEAEASYTITVKEPERPAEQQGGASAAGGTQAAGAVFLSDQVSQVLALINEQRAAAGLDALTLNSAATAAAQTRAVEIVDSFSHVRPNGNRGYTTLLDVGIQYAVAGENLGIGYGGSAAAVVNAWMNSETHRANIMKNYTDTGIACYYDPNSTNQYHWVQLFFR